MTEGGAAADFEGRVADWFRRQGLDRSLRSIVAFSGGPDSTAMLEVLVALGAGPLIAVHVDHGIRPKPEREAERKLVAQIAQKLGVEHVIVAIEEGRVDAMAKERGIGIEAAARDIRHAALRSCATDFDALRIYVGHTRDDVLESLLMRFLGGSGTAGLRGLPAIRGAIARPLIEIERAEIASYLHFKGLHASCDSTNSDEDILRNRVRKRLVPLLDKEFGSWRGGLLRTAGRLGLDDDALVELSRSSAPEKTADFSRLIPYDRFASMPAGIRFRVLVEAIDGLIEDGICPAFPGGRVPARMIGSILDSIDRGMDFSGHGISIVRDGNRLNVGPALDLEGSDGYFVVLNESDIGFERSFPDGRIALAWTNEPDMVGIHEGSFEFPLVIRTRRPGDTIALASGTKALDRLVGRWGLEAPFRSKVPVVQDRRGIVGVLGSAVPRGKDIFRFVASAAPSGRRLSLRLKGA